MSFTSNPGSASGFNQNPRDVDRTFDPGTQRITDHWIPIGGTGRPVWADPTQPSPTSAPKHG